MIEILVTLVITSVGLLGVAGLQLTGLKSNQSAYFRSQAGMIAYDMIDRMRTNSDGVNAGNYDNLSSANLPDDPNCINTSTGCSALATAQSDLREWTNTYLATLPSGSGSITRNGDVFTITVNWTDTTDLDNPAKSVAMEVQL